MLLVECLHRQVMACKINSILESQMKLFEMFNPATEGYQDLAADNSKPKWKESRKTKLTLRQIRKLRKMMDVRSFEKAKYIKKVHEQYGVKPEAGAAA